MSSWITSDPVAFTRVKEFIRPYRAEKRTDSVAFLLWFLETIYRLDEVEAQDAVTDESGDEGIDGLVVEDEQQAIVLFQSRIWEDLPKTLGDKELKRFVGSLAKFVSESTVNDIIQTTRSKALKQLLIKHDVASRVGQGYRIRPIFITNIAANSDGRSYIEAVQKGGTAIDVWDLVRLAPVLEQLQRDWFVAEPVTIKLIPDKFFLDRANGQLRMVVGAVQAKELVKLPGISDTRVFAQNVRLSRRYQSQPANRKFC